MIDPSQMGGPPAMMDPGMAAPPMDPQAPMDIPPDMDPGEVAALLGQAIAIKKEQAHQQVEEAAQMDLERVIAMVQQGAQGAETMDGPGAVPQVAQTGPPAGI